MGYTHYWTFDRPAKGTVAKTEKAFQKAILECQKIIRYESKTNGGLSGFAAYTTPGTHKGIRLNGSQSSGQCEDFFMRKTFADNFGFNFCKTGRYQYDTAVVACLIVLKYRLGEVIEINSDGEQHEWAEGLALAQKVLKLKGLKIPDSIRKSEEVSA